MLIRKIASLRAVKFYTQLNFSILQTDNDFRSYVENNYGPVFHPIGTAAMLRITRKNLKVYGVQGVRVAGKHYIIELLPCWPSESDVLIIVFSLCFPWQMLLSYR